MSTAPTASLLEGFPTKHRAAVLGAGLNRNLLIAMAIGVAVTLAGVGWAVAAPSTAKPVPSPSATTNADRATVAAAAIDELTAEVREAQGVAAEFQAPLAALQGVSDEPARAAAEAARQAYAQAVAAVVVPRAPARTADVAMIAAAEKGTSAAREALLVAGTAFHAAITSFIGTMPGFAVQAVAEHADGSADLRKAVTAAAVTMASSDPFTPPWFGPWDAWRAALAALVADAGDGTADLAPPADSGTAPVAPKPAAPAPADPTPPITPPDDPATTPDPGGPPDPPATPPAP